MSTTERTTDTFVGGHDGHEVPYEGRGEGRGERPEEAVTGALRPTSGLKKWLVGTDVTLLVLVWSGWAILAPFSGRVGAGARWELAAVAVIVSLGLIAGMHLYRARVCAVHAVEMVGMSRSVLVAGLVLQAAKAPLDIEVPIEGIVAGSMASLLALIVGRSAFRSWLGVQRRKRRHLRNVVVVGTNEEGHALVAMLKRNPQAGFDVVGILGERDGIADTGLVPWLGPASDTADVVRDLGANGAFLAASALGPIELNERVRELIADERHVHLSSPLRGISARRIRLQPISREMMFYLEPARLRRWQEDVKRAMDLTLSIVALVLASPVLLVSALVIRLSDGGPVLFRQRRVGRNGVEFVVYKLRTMVIDAEAKRAELQEHNEREGGVLFKLTDDPRVTRFGRVLRTLSIDELPQLFNVIKGEMSLVGPRPALPSEVAQFNERLQNRHQVTPGVTGLWQVEAREIPGLGVYARLDLFYVENWSVALDIAIIFATFSSVVARAARLLLFRGSATG